MSDLSQSEEDKLKEGLNALPPETRELLERRDRERLALIRQGAKVAIMIRNFSHGVGKNVVIKH